VENILHKELSYKIMGAAFEVHNVLGPGFLEKVYERALAHELRLNGISVEKQKEIQVSYKGIAAGSYVADLVANNEIIIELKAVESLNDFHQAQVLNYLKAADMQLGLLINFGAEKVQYKRLVL
jgi:GxxExxY protein